MAISSFNASLISPGTPTKLRKYVLEALRLTGPINATTRLATADTTIQDGVQTWEIKKGETVYLDLTAASVDQDQFPDPQMIKLDRPEESYLHFGWGPHTCLGRYIAINALAAQLKVLAGANGLRKVPGKRGELRSRMVNGVKCFLTAGKDGLKPVPQSKYFKKEYVYE
jgi:cytochrome P450